MSIKEGQRPRSGMYRQNVQNWNFVVGCDHKCIYCVESFQNQVKRVWKLTWRPDGKTRGCVQCRDYTPHDHDNRLNQSLRRTEGDTFIFVCSTGDISFGSKKIIKQALDRIRRNPDRRFLIQTKNPEKLFKKVKQFPENVYLDVTLETNRDKDYSKISEAPKPSERLKAYLKSNHPHKFLTIEPIFDFDPEVFLAWIKQLNPERVYIGYESKGVSGRLKLPEPTLAKTKDFIKKLSAFTTVYTKLLRKAWHEQV